MKTQNFTDSLQVSWPSVNSSKEGNQSVFFLKAGGQEVLHI
jgi:hypothetical protein